MANKRKSYNIPRSTTVNLNNVHIGGPYADMLRAKGQDKSNTALMKPNSELESYIAPERREYVEKLKNWMREPNWCSGYSWLMLREDYEIYEKQDGLTKDEYYEIAKVAINTGPEQMNRLRKDKVSDARYYELCKIMASHGVFQDVDYEKLNKGAFNGTYKIANLTIDSFVKLTEPWEFNVPCAYIAHVAREQQYVTPAEGAQLLLYMWLIRHNAGEYSDGEIRHLVNENLITPADVTKCLDRLEKAVEKGPCTGLLKSIELGRTRDVPDFCQAAYRQVLSIYQKVVDASKSKSQLFRFTR